MANKMYFGTKLWQVKCISGQNMKNKMCFGTKYGK